MLLHIESCDEKYLDLTSRFGGDDLSRVEFTERDLNRRLFLTSPPSQVTRLAKTSCNVSLANWNI